MTLIFFSGRKKRSNHPSSNKAATKPQDQSRHPPLQPALCSQQSFYQIPAQQVSFQQPSPTYLNQADPGPQPQQNRYQQPYPQQQSPAEYPNQTHPTAPPPQNGYLKPNHQQQSLEASLNRECSDQAYLSPPPQQNGYLQPYLQPLPLGTTHSTANLHQEHPQLAGRRKSPLHRVNQAVHQASKSVSNLGETLSGHVSNTTVYLNHASSRSSLYFHQSVANLSTAIEDRRTLLLDLLSSKLDAAITSMDEEQFDGDECDMVLHYPDEPHQPQPESSSSQALNPVPQTPSTGTVSFAKVWLYSNSRLPPHMPPFKVYMPTYPLLCLAAKYSQRAYNRPTGAERDTHVPANWRHWTKAMVLKSLPIDSMNTVVVAIRGSQSFMDWAVNFRDAPKAPEGFLDDGGNLCHAGFLHVARQMIAPIANHLRALLLENPSRSNCSLLITGHSAGGAVAALLYAHMMSTTVQSELNRLAGFFKRIHCITFGAPPITLIPLQRPDGLRCRKSLFFSIINEGDLVARADSQVIKSLLALLAKPAPTFSLTKMVGLSNLNLHSSSHQKHKTNKRPKPRPAWLVPPTTLSLAGRIVVLRERPGMRGEVNVEAVVASDEEMREVIYGDVLMHRMSLYVHRVEALSVSAVTVGEA